jgi:hypothetical protein
MFGSDSRGGGVHRRNLLRSGAVLVPSVLTASSPALSPSSPGAMAGADPQAQGRAALTPRQTRTADWDAVAGAFGRPGNLIRGIYYHTPFPRSDLSVVSQGVRVTPGLALASHASFAAYGDGSTLMMGDMVVPESGLQQFLDDLCAAGIMVTAVHKHLLAHTPALWWVHACAVTAAPTTVACGLRAALDRAGTPPQAATAHKELSGLDTDGIDAAIGARGTANGEVYTTVFVRREAVVDGGRLLPAGLGASTAVNFQPVGAGRAAVSGDFAMVAGEVPAALAALRRGGLRLVSLHNHGLTDEPRLFFTHFWAVDDAVRIARALHDAVALTNVAPAAIA